MKQTTLNYKWFQAVCDVAARQQETTESLIKKHAELEKGMLDIRRSLLERGVYWMDSCGFSTIQEDNDD
jgi:hypothetical protein